MFDDGLAHHQIAQHFPNNKNHQYGTEYIGGRLRSLGLTRLKSYPRSKTIISISWNPDLSSILLRTPPVISGAVVNSVSSELCLGWSDQGTAK
jgi:hypothetical protein